MDMRYRDYRRHAAVVKGAGSRHNQKSACRRLERPLCHPRFHRRGLALGQTLLEQGQALSESAQVAVEGGVPEVRRVGLCGGIAHSAAVAPGQLLGSGTATMRFAWDREGHAINAAPLLRATLTR